MLIAASLTLLKYLFILIEKGVVINDAKFELEYVVRRLGRVRHGRRSFRFLSGSQYP